MKYLPLLILSIFLVSCTENEVVDTKKGAKPVEVN